MSSGFLDRARTVGANLLRKYTGELLFGFSSAASAATGLFASTVASRFLSPTEMGIMQTVALVPVYCVFLSCGVFNGLSRDIGFHVGRQDSARVQDLINASWATAWVVGLVGLALSIVLAGYFLLFEYPLLYLSAMLFVGVHLLLEPFSLHLDVVYLATRSFGSLGRRNLTLNALFLVASLLPIVAGALGFVASRLVFIVTRYISRAIGHSPKATARGSLRDATSLAKTGIPLATAGVLYSYLNAADRSLVATMMKPEDVGLYTLSTLVIAAVQFTPFCIASIFYPRVSACFGREGNSAALRPYLWSSIGADLVAVVPIGIILYFTIGPFTRRFLPAYIDGIDAAKISCLGSFAYIFVSASTIISATRRNAPYIICLVVSIALVWILGSYLISNGYGLAGVAWARVGATAILCTAALTISFLITRSESTKHVR